MASVNALASAALTGLTGFGPVCAGASPSGGTRISCPSSSRWFDLALLPSTRTWPVRSNFSSRQWPRSGKRRENHRSSLRSVSSAVTVTLCTPLKNLLPGKLYQALLMPQFLDLLQFPFLGLGYQVIDEEGRQHAHGAIDVIAEAVMEQAVEQRVAIQHLEAPADQHIGDPLRRHRDGQGLALDRVGE